MLHSSLQVPARLACKVHLRTLTREGIHVSIFILNLAFLDHSSAVGELSPCSGYLYLYLGLIIFTMTFEEDGASSLIRSWVMLAYAFC
jgi:hypothetical protein